MTSFQKIMMISWIQGVTKLKISMHYWYQAYLNRTLFVKLRELVIIFIIQILFDIEN